MLFMCNIAEKFKTLLLPYTVNLMELVFRISYI